LFGGFDFFDEGVPLVATRTFADPFGAFKSARFAEKGGFGFAHGARCMGAGWVYKDGKCDSNLF